jgi:two-component system NtrC family sensor kinase
MAKAQRDSIRLLQGALIAAIALPSALFVYSGWLGFENAQKVADSQIERTTDVIDEHAQKVFEAVDRTLAEINEIIRDMSDAAVVDDEAHLHARLRRLAADSAEIKSVWVFDRNGRALVNSLNFPAGDTDFSDRDYFAAHIDKDIDTYVGAVLRPRPPYGGAPFFGVSRRRFSSDGKFAGVIQASILPEYFEGFYEKLAREPGAYASLIRDDGLVLARFPSLGRDAHLAPQGPLFQSMLKQPTSGSVTLVSAIDGTGRQVSYRKLGKYPVFVLAGLETAAIRSQWISQLTSQLFFGLPATAALIGLVALALARTRSLHAEAAGRAAAEEALKQSQRLEALGQLTGGVAHDFNNLLMIIGGSAERAKSRTADPQISRSLDMIAVAVNKGGALTRRLLSFSRRHALAPSTVDLADCLEKVEEVLRQSVPGNIALQVGATQSGAIVTVDVDELEIALLNLTLNARDAMPNGGFITITLQTVQLAPGEGPEGLSGEFAVISVKDTGSGISDDVRERIFEPYFTTKADKGNGLGLSQVYGFLQQSAGAITVESIIGQGAKFNLFFPLSHEATLTEKRPSSPIGSHQSGGWVLLVEDNNDVAAVAADHLEQCGCVVVRAESAASAINVLENNPEIDLVFSDIVMPGMSGLDLGRWVRTQFPDIPVVLATGYSEQAAAAVREGFALLNKPYSFDALSDALARSGMRCRAASSVVG